MRKILPVLLPGLLCVMPPLQAEWFKGVTHIHSLWSDGDSAPEVIVDWYKERGYDFISMSDHFVLQEGEKLVDIKPDSPLTAPEVEAIRARFGAEWVVTTGEEGAQKMRLKTHEELKAHFDVPGEFLMFPAEEITTLKGPHVNALNIRKTIANGEGDFAVLIQQYIDEVNAQRQKYGVPMIAHVNHINFSSGVTTEELLKVNGLEFFEVYNGHPSVHNWGRPEKGMPSTDVHWDVLQALNQVKDPAYTLYAVATDDSHEYKEWGVGKSNPGRGWIMVDAPALEANSLIEAMQQGRFYATTGVLLDKIQRDENSLSFEIQPAPGVKYVTQFIGTLQGFDRTSHEVRDATGTPLPRASRRYSPEIGCVLHETTDLAPRYPFTGNELYVRAKVVSDKLQENPFAEGDYETAWVQPVPGK